MARRVARQKHAQERALASARHIEAVRHLVEPVEFSFSLPARFPAIASNIKLAWRQGVLYKDLEGALAPFRGLLSALPAPPRMARFQREAKEAWLGFHQGDPEPLDSFIRKYLIRLRIRNRSS